MASAIMGNPDRLKLSERLTTSFCAIDPAIAREFAKVTFLSNNRADLSSVVARTLVLQCPQLIAPIAVAEYVAEVHL